MRRPLLAPMWLVLVGLILGGAVAHAATAAASPAAAAASSIPASPHAMPGPMAATEKTKQPPAAPEKLVDINSAGRKELMTLPGIGAAEADKIIANRPYLTKTELVSKQVLPTGPYLSLRYKVVAMQKFKPVTGAKAQAAKAAPAASGSKAP